ncbi:MAG TPA: hypothetical protein VET65_01985 [Candidatus Limnocylindrales bacterium]|nr:hypothetical protein [Candidatus Limnocylindrales bacterium]
MSPSASAAPSAPPSATPLFAFPVASGVACPDLKALGLDRAVLRATDPNRTDVVLCDAQDLAHPRRLAPLANSEGDVFLTHDLIGYVMATGGGPSSTPDQFTAVVRTLDLLSGHVTDVATSPGVPLGSGWSADQSMVAYFTDTGSHHFWLKRGAAGPAALAPAIPLFGRGGSPDDELLVTFSADGQYVAFVDTFVYRLQIFRTADGVAVYAAPSGGAGGLRTMGAWGHANDVFYFRNNSGVYRWDPAGGIAVFSSGLKWASPAFSTSDRLVAYAVVAADGTPHVEIRDPIGGTTVSTTAWRSAPRFLSDHALLLEVDQACPPDSMCTGFVPAGKSVVFKLDTHTETDLGLSGWSLGPFWPHA